MVSNRPPSRSVSFLCPTRVRRLQIVLLYWQARTLKFGGIGAEALLRSPMELHEAIAFEGRVAPHTDPELKRKPRCYARLVRDVSLRGLVSFRPPSEASVGVFLVPNKQGKQRLIFDTRRCESTFSAGVANNARLLVMMLEVFAFPSDTNNVVNGLETVELKIREFERYSSGR